MIERAKRQFHAGVERTTIHGLLEALFAVGAISLGFATMAGFAGALWWPLDLFNHFRLQYAVLALIVALAAGATRRRRTFFALIGCSALNAVVLVPYLIPSGPSSFNAWLTAATINVNTANRDYFAVRDYVRRSNADVILLLEVDDAWMQGLSDLRGAYPYGVAQPRMDNFGIALLSRLPCDSCRILNLGSAGVPSVRGDFLVPSPAARAESSHGARAGRPPRRIAIIGTHPLPPIGAEYARQHQDQLDELAEYLRAIHGPRILMGDLNSSPASARFRRLLRQAGLHDGAAGRSLARTWPVDNPLLGVRIDHILAAGATVVSVERGPDVGSDHFPVLTGLIPDLPAPVARTNRSPPSRAIE
jgi:endonuclease/exonuclease/phosphatase (EEP) superfamily protein YafD